MQRNNLKTLFFYASPIIIALTGLVCSCASRHAVIAVTGTNIGVEISQNPANQSPQAKLGYQRGEVAIVPSNRSGNVEPTSGTSTIGGGASDVADVLMELRYANIFSFNNAGIYQRLAVGKNAVKQPGAALMFAKDQKGEIDPQTAEAINNALSSIPETSEDVLKARAPLTKVYNTLKNTKMQVFDEAAKTQGYMDYENFVLNKPSQPTLSQVNKVRQELEKDVEIKAELEK